MLRPAQIIHGSRMHKLNHELVDQQYLAERERRICRAGFTTPRWLSLCGLLLLDGYQVAVYEPPGSNSKYITVFDGHDLQHGRGYKIRVSDHKPILHREANAHCDFFVGVTHFHVFTIHDARNAVNQFFRGDKDDRDQHGRLGDAGQRGAAAKP